jgi:hypothetical protein
MKQVSFCCVVFLLLVSLTSGMLSACKANTNITSTAPAVQTTSASVQTTVATATTASGQTTTASGQTTTTGGQTSATTSGTVLPSGIPAIADMKSLPSYRYSIMTTLKEGAAAGSKSYMKYEWVKAQKAEHAWLEDASGKITETYITIGNKTWIWLPMKGWMEQPPKTTETSIPSDLADQLKKAQQDIEHSKMRFEKKGTETVNNVKCIKYEYDYYLTVEMPNMVTGGTTKTEMHAVGNMWIANQADLPTVVIRSVSTTEINAGGDKTVMESDQNLTNIGAAIHITPPT